jgi:hypothetical protein
MDTYELLVSLSHLVCLNKSGVPTDRLERIRANIFDDATKNLDSDGQLELIKSISESNMKPKWELVKPYLYAV